MPRPHLILAICCLSVLLVTMDVTIVNVALPSIQSNFKAELSHLQWVIDAYTLVVASLLLLSGSMADRFGRRLVFQIGLIVFTIGSLLCSLAPNIETLIAFRALQGVGGSMLNPVALSIITTTYSDSTKRARAIGVWGAVSGAALGLGPLLGGALTQTVGWRFIFLVNVPIGIAAAILAALFVPESKAPRVRAFDPIGQGLVIVVLGALTYALIEVQHAGLGSWPIIGLFVLSGVALIALLRYEPRLQEPLLDMRFFSSVPFSGATLIAVASFGSFAALLFVNALYLQLQRGLSALQTGLCTLPVAIMVVIFAPVSGRIVGRFGTRPSLLMSGAGMIAGTVMLTQLSDTYAIWLLLLAYTLFGFGFGLVNPTISAVAVAGMPSSQVGVAAAIASASRQVGSVLGIAIAGTIVNASRVQGADLARATHPIWWVLAGCGLLIAFLGVLTNTAWGQKTARDAASSFHSEAA
jgi:EmrB/QacA subfamily drug resistance transporter